MESLNQLLNVHNGFPKILPAEIALQHVSMFFRSEPKWEVVEPLKDIGKLYYTSIYIISFLPPRPIEYSLTAEAFRVEVPSSPTV